MRIEFTLRGRPQPKRRPRVTSRGTFTPGATPAYEKAIGNVALVARMKAHVGGAPLWPQDAEYTLSVSIFIKGKALMDLDNVIKSVADGMEGVLFTNDRQVAELHGYRAYGVAAGDERTEVVLEVL